MSGSAQRRVVVVGGGVAGLSTAAVLARHGRRVVLLESRDRLGGRADTWDTGGFRFDTGPSWLLMRSVFDRFYEGLGTTTAHELAPVRLDPAFRVFFEAYDAPLTVPGRAAAVAALFEEFEPGAGRRLEAYLDSARRTAGLAEEHLLYNPGASAADFVSRATLLAAPRLANLLGTSLHRFVARRFRDERLRQILGYPAVFLGTSPYRAPAMYHLMSAYDLEEGVFYPRGGFGTVVSSIAELAVGHGAEVRTGARVTQILVEGGRATGVRYRTPDGVEHTEPADDVVSTADRHHTETALLGPGARSYPESWWARRQSGPGAVLVMLGVRGRLDTLAHHSLFFASDWAAGFDAIFGAAPHVPDPASLYVCRPSATDPDVAPAGHENLFVLVPVPADPGLGSGGTDGVGDAAVEAVADRAIAQIAAWAGIPDLARRVVVRRTIGPGDFARDLSAWRGGMLGLGHTLRQSAILRPQTRSRRVPNLFHAGASSAPGIGLPMCLISAELVRRSMDGERGAAPPRALLDAREPA